MTGRDDIPAEVRELVEMLRTRTIYKPLPGQAFLSKSDPDPLCTAAADALERLASRPYADHEAVRQRAVEEAVERGIYEGMRWVAQHQRTQDFHPPQWENARGTQARVKAAELARAALWEDAQ